MVTRTRVAEDRHDSVVIDGRTVVDEKIATWLASLRHEFEIPAIRVDSTSNFPVNSGLASSASGFAALSLAVATAFDLDLELTDLCQWARRGSASAARSLHGGFVALEPVETGCRTKQILDEHAWELSVVVAVTSDEQKGVGSTAGMRISQATSPYYEAWVTATKIAFQQGLEALRNRDLRALGDIAEASCRQMHALMLSSEPALIYWNGVTLACIDAIRSLRESGTPVFYTVDAGPHVKAICETAELGKVTRLMSSIEGVRRVLESKIGGPARTLTDE